MLLVRSYRNLRRHVVRLRRAGHSVRADDAAQRAIHPRAQAKLFYDDLLDAPSARAGVTMTASAQGIPFSGWNMQSIRDVEGRRRRSAARSSSRIASTSLPATFPAIGVKLVARPMAHRHGSRLAQSRGARQRADGQVHGFGGRDPIGKRVRVGGDDEPLATVVGVAARLSALSAAAADGAGGLLPVRDVSGPRADDRHAHDHRAIRTTLVPALRRAVRASIRSSRCTTFRRSTSRCRSRSGGSGSRERARRLRRAALVLACTGLYGVMPTRWQSGRASLACASRSARRSGDVLRLVLGQSGRLVSAVSR